MLSYDYNVEPKKNPIIFVVETGKMAILTQKSSVENAVQICSQLGGEMPMPESVSELESLFGKISNFSENGCEGSYWVPIVRSATNKLLWESIQGKFHLLYHLFENIEIIFFQIKKNLKTELSKMISSRRALLWHGGGGATGES